MDPIAGVEVMELFKTLCVESGVSLLYSTHNISHAVHYADRLLAMKGGRISLDDHTANLIIDKLSDEYE